MPIRKTKFTQGEIYHLCNRSNDKGLLFKDTNDWVRFLILMLYFQSPTTIYNISRMVKTFSVRRPASNTLDDINTNTESNIIKNRYVEILCFAIMPNHFHILIQEKQENGISKYVHKIQTAYAKYFNTKYKKTGHLFQGPFRAVHIKDNEQLLHTSAYIHRNPRELKEWFNKEHTYLYSSYTDYTNKNRWGQLINTSIILDQFNNLDTQTYKKFLEESGTKNSFESENQQYLES